MRARVTMFYNITNNVVTIDPNQYVTHQQKITRSTNKLQFQTYNTFHRQYASGTHYQPALLCQASPWISLKLWSKVTKSKSPLFFCTVYIHVIFYVYFENLSCLFSLMYIHQYWWNIVKSRSRTDIMIMTSLIDKLTYT